MPETSKNNENGMIQPNPEKQEENPYRYYNLSKNNIIPLFIYIIGLVLIWFVGYFLQILLTEGSNWKQLERIVYYIVILFLIMMILISKQNTKHITWEKDKKIEKLKDTSEEQNTKIRDLIGKQKELEGTITSIEKKLKSCVEEKKKIREEMEKLRKEKETLTQEVKRLEEKTSALRKERDALKNENIQLNDKLQKITSIKNSYEKKVEPYIEVKSFMSEERGKILGIFKVDDVYNISFENKGIAPAFNITGKVIFYPTIGSPKERSVSIPRLLPTQKLSKPLGGKKQLGECSKITVDITYLDILGKNHKLKGDIIYK